MKKIEVKCLDSINCGYDGKYYFILINAKDYKFKRMFTRKDKRDKHFFRIEKKLENLFTILK